MAVGLAVEVIVAETPSSGPMVMTHVGLVPVHPPLHAVSEDPAEGIAVSVTPAPPVIPVDVQVAPQSIPPTLEVTVPEPVPDLVIEMGDWASAVPVRDPSSPNASRNVRLTQPRVVKQRLRPRPVVRVVPRSGIPVRVGSVSVVCMVHSFGRWPVRPRNRSVGTIVN